MRTFVISDNLAIYTAIREILDSKVISESNCTSPSPCSYDKNIESKSHTFKSIDYFQSANSTALDRHNIPHISLKHDYKKLMDYELGFSIHCKQIFPKELVNNVLCINLHPGLNPYNRGIYPHVFSMLNGLPAGATLHVMDSDIDSGEIIAQKEIEISESDTSLSLYSRVLQGEIDLFKSNIDSILKGDFARRKSSKGNYNSMRDFKALCHIDLDRQLSMRDAIRFLSAMSHSPYKNAFFINKDGRKVFVELSLMLDSKYGGGGGKPFNTPTSIFVFHAQYGKELIA